MKRKYDTIQSSAKQEENLWSLFLHFFSCKDIANIVFEYCTPFEMRPSHLNVHTISRSDLVIPTKSGWIYPVIKKNKRTLCTTFNDFEIEFIDLAFQFWDHTLDNDLIVILKKSEKSENDQRRVETWNVFDQILVGSFDLESSKITEFQEINYKCNMIHLPVLQRILSWLWNEIRNGGYLYLMDYWNKNSEWIQFSQYVYFLDVVIQPNQKEISFLFQAEGTYSFLMTYEKKIKFPDSGLYWLDYPSCILRKDKQKLHNQVELYRFYQCCYGNKFHHRELGPTFMFEIQSSGMLELWLGTEQNQTLLGHFSMNIRDKVQLPPNVFIFRLRLYGGTQRDFAVFCEYSFEYSTSRYQYNPGEGYAYLFVPKGNKCLPLIK